MNQKKYILKPGKHQFAPGSPAEHDNDNLTDEEAEWYLERYPHIASLFEERPKGGKTGSPEEATGERPVVKRKRINQNQTAKIVPIGEIILQSV